MDIKLGQVNITTNQIQHLGEVQFAFIKGLSYVPNTGILTAVTSRALTNNEKTQIINAVNVLPNTIVKAKTSKDIFLEMLDDVDIRQKIRDISI